MNTNALLAIVTGTTCGDACWHAREEICRCSCGGKNHGCLRDARGERPVRSAKLDGDMYELKAIGKRAEIYKEATEINRAKVRSTTPGGYKYYWRETDPGAPARVKFPSKDQVKRWPELAAWYDKTTGKPTREFYRENICFLWVKPTPVTLQHPDGTEERHDSAAAAIAAVIPAPDYCATCGEIDCSGHPEEPPPQSAKSRPRQGCKQSSMRPPPGQS